MSDLRQVLDLKNRVKTLEINAIADHNRIVWLYEKLEKLCNETIGDDVIGDITSNLNASLNVVEQVLQQ
jgi:hypothetical protein